MSFTPLTIPPRNWPDTPQYTASGDTEIELINPGTWPVYFMTTDDDTKPALAEGAASPIRSAEPRVLTLRDGERLWLVAPFASVSVSVTLHY